MYWLGIALVAHVLNALVFAVDKSLLSTKESIINQPGRYAALSGLVAAGTAVVLPFGFAWPNTFIITWSLIAGFFWVVALWLFFIALKHGESSRVVPITGSAVPFFTLIIVVTLLGQKLAWSELLAIAALIVGGFLLSVRLTASGGISNKIILAAIGSGAAFAAHFAIMDYIYDNFSPFLAAFAYSRIGVGLAALALLFITMSKRGQNFKNDSSREKIKRSAKRAGWLVFGAFFASKLIGAVALLLQNYAISLGNVAIINALQGTQYLFILLIAMVITRFWPKLFTEELARGAVAQKIIGILVITFGLSLLV